MLFDFWRHKYNRCGPREKVRIAVMYQVASYWPSIESFYRACVNDDSVDIRIFFVNEFLSSQGIAVRVGLNPWTILTSGILGTPGVALLYGISFYGIM